MNDYTAHIQLPDAPVGALFQNAVLDAPNVSCSTVRSGNGTWLSFGVNASSDDEASMQVSTVRLTVSRMNPKSFWDLIPGGYDPSIFSLFEQVPMIITSGRTVIHSEGI